ncbi:MAG: translocation/assembly module TamB domain-containing protein [Aquimonas sp.]|nr:translocation/assembly module TamB domain-containing protein [Aquimonas sp.]
MSAPPWLRWGLWLSLAALLVLLLALWLLLGSGLGRQLALSQLRSALPEQALSWESEQGSLLGGLELRGLRYRDEAIELDVDRVSLKLVAMPLLGRRLDIQRLQLETVRLRLLAEPTPEPVEAMPWPPALPQRLPALELPVAVRLQSLELVDFALLGEAEAPAFEVDSLQLAADLSGGQLQLMRLQLDAPLGRLALDGSIDTRPPQWALQLEGAGAWTPIDQPPLDFGLSVAGGLDALQLELAARGPEALRLRIETQAGLPSPQARIELQMAALPPALGIDLPLAALALELEGGLERVEARGELMFDGRRIELEQAVLSIGSGLLLDIEALRLRREGGAVALAGQLDLSGPAPLLDARVDFEQFVVHEAGAPPLRIDGRVSAQGPLQALELSPALRLSRDGLAVDLQGQLQLALPADAVPALEAIALQLRSPEGRLDLTGRVTLGEALAWDLQLALDRFDPALLAPDWPGAVDARIDSRGRLGEGGPQGQVQLQSLSGQLRGRALEGGGEAELDASGALSGDLSLALGDSRLRLLAGAREGLEGPLQAQLRLAPMVLADWIDGGEGRIEGELRLSGQRQAPRITGELVGSALALDKTLRVGGLRFSVSAGLARGETVELRLEASNLSAAGQDFAELELAAAGRADAHDIDLRVVGEEGQLSLSAAGGLAFSANGAPEAWSGRLDSLDFEPGRRRAGMGRWRLESPAALSLSGDRQRIETLCLRPQAARRGGARNSEDAPEDAGALCLQADLAAGRGEAALRLQALPLALPGGLLSRALEQNPPWRWSGALDGELRLQLQGDSWQIDGELLSEAGGIASFEAANQPLLEWSALRVSIDASPAAARLAVEGGLGTDGRIDGQVNLQRPLEPEGDLQGQLLLSLNDLGALQLLSAGEITDPQGRLSASLDLAGQRNRPELDARLRLDGFSGELPAMGVRFEQGEFELQTGSPEVAELSFSLVSGGRLEGRGRLDFSPDAETLLEMDITGERVLLADTPELRLIASPRLQLARRGDLIRVRGDVQVPEALIRLDRIEGTAQPSRDVVVLDPVDPRAEVAAAQQVDADVRVALGEDVRLEGFGLDGRIAGELRVRDRPGRATTGSGSLNVTGRYKAYGQDLDITRGRLAFAQSPLENPNLDISAERRFDRVTAGIRVTGSALDPQLSLWSSPALDQADILSYLVLGRPLRAARGDEGRQLNAAAAALGAGGNFIAERLGARLGFDTAGIEESSALGGAALTVGKFLSPRLYVSYGVALFGEGQVFTVKYLLNELWDLQLDASERENRASLNYRLER